MRHQLNASPFVVSPPPPPYTPNKLPLVGFYEKLAWNRTGRKCYFGINQNWIVCFLSNTNPNKTFLWHMNPRTQNEMVGRSCLVLTSGVWEPSFGVGIQDEIVCLVGLWVVVWFCDGFRLFWFIYFFLNFICFPIPLSFYCASFQMESREDSTPKRPPKFLMEIKCFQSLDQEKASEEKGGTKATHPYYFKFLVHAASVLCCNSILNPEAITVTFKWPSKLIVIFLSSSHLISDPTLFLAITDPQNISLRWNSFIWRKNSLGVSWFFQQSSEYSPRQKNCKEYTISQAGSKSSICSFNWIYVNMELRNPIQLYSCLFKPRTHPLLVRWLPMKKLKY